MYGLTMDSCQYRMDPNGSDDQLTPDADLNAVLLLDAGEILRGVGESIRVECEGAPLQFLHPQTVEVQDAHVTLTLAHTAEER